MIALRRRGVRALQLLEPREADERVELEPQAVVAARVREALERAAGGCRVSARAPPRRCQGPRWRRPAPRRGSRRARGSGARAPPPRPSAPSPRGCRRGRRGRPGRRPAPRSRRRSRRPRRDALGAAEVGRVLQDRGEALVELGRRAVMPSAARATGPPGRARRRPPARPASRGYCLRARASARRDRAGCAAGVDGRLAATSSSAGARLPIAIEVGHRGEQLGRRVGVHADAAERLCRAPVRRERAFPGALQLVDDGEPAVELAAVRGRRPAPPRLGRLLPGQGRAPSSPHSSAESPDPLEERAAVLGVVRRATARARDGPTRARRGRRARRRSPRAAASSAAARGRARARPPSARPPARAAPRAVRAARPAAGGARVCGPTERRGRAPPG